MKAYLKMLVLVMILVGCNQDDTELTELLQLRQKELILGEWELVSFVNEADGTSINPDDVQYYRSFKMVLAEDSSCRIYSVNIKGGSYSLIFPEQMLTISISFSTMAGWPSDWDDMFTKNIEEWDSNTNTANVRENYFVASDHLLKIYYSEHEYMKFQRLDSLYFCLD